MKMSLFSEVSTSCVDFPLISPLTSSPAKHMRFVACVCGCMVSVRCRCMGVQLHGFHWVSMHVCAVTLFLSGIGACVCVCVCVVARFPLGVRACVRSHGFCQVSVYVCVCVCARGHTVSIRCWCMCAWLRGFHWVLVCMCAVARFSGLAMLPHHWDFYHFICFVFVLVLLPTLKEKWLIRKAKKTQTKEHRGKCAAKFSFSVAP